MLFIIELLESFLKKKKHEFSLYEEMFVCEISGFIGASKLLIIALTLLM